MDNLNRNLALALTISLSTVSFASLAGAEETYYGDEESYELSTSMRANAPPSYTQTKTKYSSSVKGNVQRSMKQGVSSIATQTNNLSKHTIKVLNGTSKTTLGEQSATVFTHMVTYTTNGLLGIIGLISKIVTYPLELLTSTELPHINNNFTETKFKQVDTPIDENCIKQ